MNVKRKRVDALVLKSGPTESGPIPNDNHIRVVGGEVISVDRLAVLISKFWPVLLLLVPLGFLLYKKRNTILQQFMRLAS
jgi:hypothetical protein